jgi:hypothetical protein
LCEVQVIPITKFNSIGSDAPIPSGDYGASYSQKLGSWPAVVDQMPIGILWLPVAMNVEGVAIDRFNARIPSGMVFGVQWREVSAEIAEEKHIDIRNIIGSEICVSFEDGNRLYESIASALREGKRARVSFKNAAEISSAFLESAIGRLYERGFKEEEIEKGLAIQDLSDDDRFMLEMVIDRVKDFLRDPDRFEASINEVLGEGDG